MLVKDARLAFYSPNILSPSKQIQIASFLSPEISEKTNPTHIKIKNHQAGPQKTFVEQEKSSINRDPSKDEEPKRAD